MENVSLSLSKRYLVTLVEQDKLAFPAYWIQDILIIEREKLLVLPFYPSTVLGVINYQNQIVPLVSLAVILGKKFKKDFLPQKLTILRLNGSVEEVGGVGLVVDQLMGSITEAELDQVQIFELSKLSDDIWHPI